MTATLHDDRASTLLRNRIPEVTVVFWIIKILTTTTGETAADYLNGTLGLGLSTTSLIMTGLLAIALVGQFLTKRYVPAMYWTVVVLISIVGTLLTDNLTDGLGFPLWASTSVFVVLLGGTFAIWYAREKTLSIHTVFTRRREAFYWVAILFTFSLGTAAGDLLSEALGLGYVVSTILFAALIAAVAVAWKFGLNAVTAFWVAYILTRPLGASVGDLLSQPVADGGLGLGTTVTSVVFLIVIVALVGYLTWRIGRDRFSVAPRATGSDRSLPDPA